MNVERGRGHITLGRAKPVLPRHPIQIAPNDDDRQPDERHGNWLTRYLSMLGPGLVTGASDDDPAGIITYAMAGASLGFAMLWTAIVTIPLMLAMQFISARIGLVRGNGIAGVIKQAYGQSWLIYPAAILVLVANTINLGADIGAIAQAIEINTGVPASWLIVPITVAIVLTLTFGSYRIISTIFKWLTLPLLAYIAAAFLAHPSPGAVLRGTFLPHLTLSKQYLTMVVAILGTTITPYLWFWQANQEVEETKTAHRASIQTDGASDEAIRRSIWDIGAGIGLSNLVFFSIIVATGSTLYQSGHHTINSSADAAAALAPAAGSLATLLFTIGIIGAGTLAVPVLAGSASYAIGESFGWQVGIDRPWYRAKAFYAVIVVSCLIGMLINFTGISAVTALFYSAVVNGLIAPPLMVVIMLVANNERVMGQQVNNRMVNVIGWSATLLMSLAAVLMLVTM
jgi:NRAMP (natural resistance-associated macrophage protein)-like metal ion transporter